MMDTIRRILALTWKELLATLKDPSGRFSLLIPPIIQCIIFGYAATYDLNDVPFLVLDQDHTRSSHELIARLEGSGAFHRVATLNRIEEMRNEIDQQHALMAIQIGPDFERRLLSGTSADVQVIADGRNSNSAGTAMGYVGEIVNGFNADWQKQHNMSGPPVSVTLRSWYNPNLETRWNMVPGLIGTLTMLQTFLLTAMSVAREREQGTFDQLLVTPFRPLEIMAGKALPSILIGLFQASSILLVAQLWFRIPFIGSFVTLYMGLILFLLASVGIGLLVSSVAATMQQAMLFSFVLSMPFSLLSGLTTPISSMPDSFQYATLLNPLRYAIDMVHRVYLEGSTVTQLAPDLWPLAALAVLTLSAATWMFRNRVS